LNKRPIDRQRPTASHQNDSWTSFPGAVKVQLAATDVDQPTRRVVPLRQLRLAVIASDDNKPYQFRSLQFRMAHVDWLSLTLRLEGNSAPKRAEKRK
jgi:hypothetical protein